MTSTCKDGDLEDGLKPALAHVAGGLKLDEAQAEAAFGVVMAGEATPAQIGGLLMALRVRGETVAELTGAVRALRRRMLRVQAPRGAIDVCGTGGDQHGTLNISTAVAFVLAACGVPVAKHGNRALSSRAGASDVLAALGVPPVQDVAELQAELADHDLAFMAAPAHHPALRFAAAVRAELGTRTLFNLLGPLCNPASVQLQLIGVYDRRWLIPVVETLRRLGSARVWAVHGMIDGDQAGQGLDELTLAGPSWVVALEDGVIHELVITPAMAGLPPAPVAAIAGGDGRHNALALEALLRGARGAYRDTVLLNAAAALRVARGGNMFPRTMHGSGTPAAATGEAAGAAEAAVLVRGLREAVREAACALDDGSALAVLERLRCRLRDRDHRR
ncbi:anthranilate phosphoribosyltransferase [Lichenicoccus sp.]|uniref:anthranilate phosphoribosyltransferase n=1 Tax=Lichenicoccus sp. TaxID=2781899 RepID=UPI003D0A8771